jgi:lipoic acid synthetase
MTVDPGRSRTVAGTDAARTDLHRAGFVKKKISFDERSHDMKARLRRHGQHSVCEEARCPNISECFGSATATFLVMGGVCTRRCAFCSVAGGVPGPLDPAEIDGLVAMVGSSGLRYAVVTSVTRDDLPDAGAGFLAAVAGRVAAETPARVELLFPDMSGRKELLDTLLQAPISVYNHNIEMPERLYPVLRSRADYGISLSVLRSCSSAGKITKTGFMVGLGETRPELDRLIGDVADAGVRILTIGQYLRPTNRNPEVVRYYGEQEFAELGRTALRAGITAVASGPFVRSSYRAGELFRTVSGSEDRQKTDPLAGS